MRRSEKSTIAAARLAQLSDEQLRERVSSAHKEVRSLRVERDLLQAEISDLENRAYAALDEIARRVKEGLYDF